MCGILKGVNLSLNSINRDAYQNYKATETLKQTFNELEILNPVLFEDINQKQIQEMQEDGMNDRGFSYIQNFIEIKSTIGGSRISSLNNSYMESPLIPPRRRFDQGSNNLPFTPQKMSPTFNVSSARKKEESRRDTPPVKNLEIRESI